MTTTLETLQQNKNKREDDVNKEMARRMEKMGIKQRTKTPYKREEHK